MSSKVVDKSLISYLTGKIIVWDRGRGVPSLPRVWQHVKLSDVSLGIRPRYSLVADEDVKKPKKQTAGKGSDGLKIKLLR